MILTENEKWSLSLAESEHTRQIRLVYFEMLRCEDCNPHGKLEFRSCWPHVDKIVSVP